MSKLAIQYDILQDAPASASPVEANFNRIEQHINQELIERGGTVAMLAQLQLAGNPEAPLDATPKQYVDSIFPVGVMMMYGGASPPPGGRWAICNGAELESALYPELYAVVGSAYSPVGTPAGRFNLPNLVDRFPVGQGTIGSLGKTGGNRNPVVTAHTHQIDHAHPAGNTGSESAWHVHAGVDHLHGDDHYHGGSTGGQSNSHAHGYNVRNDPISGSQGVIGRSNAGGTIVGFATDAANQDHSHAVGTNYKSQQGFGASTGAADRSLQTGGNNVAHTHAFTTPGHVGRSASEGVSGTDTNLPPFIAVNYIIRIK